jgi:hypothetical protein
MRMDAMLSPAAAAAAAVAAAARAGGAPALGLATAMGSPRRGGVRA